MHPKRTHALRRLAVCALVGMLIGVALIYVLRARQERAAALRLRGLAEVLWVADRDLTEYHAPGTPQSLGIARMLVEQDPGLDGRQFTLPILYRSGLRATDADHEPLLIVGFDPGRIPDRQKRFATVERPAR